MQIQTLGPGPCRGELATIKAFVGLSAAMKSDPLINWATDAGDILAVDWYDLGHLTHIPWKDVNIVVTETFQQIVDTIHLFDLERSYIIVTE